MATTQAKIRVVVHYPAVRQTLKGPEIRRLLLSMGRSIATTAGPGNAVKVDETPTRVGVDVFTETPEAMVREATTRSLTRAIQAGRR
jgi:hypothetical protein